VPQDIDCIIHLAALTDVSYCQNNPVDCFQVNVYGTQNMIEIARKINSKFLYLSTSHVYGIPKALPIKEDHPRNPTSIYSASKLAGEIVCESYANSYDMDVSIIRLFSVYGPKSPEHLVTSRIILQSLKNDSIKLGNLYPKRDFIYIKDVVCAIELVLKKTSGLSTYNIGSGKSYSILELCNVLQKISGRKIRIESIKSKARKNDVNNVISNNSKIRKLGWKPKTYIDSGLKETFEWFSKQ